MKSGPVQPIGRFEAIEKLLATRVNQMRADRRHLKLNLDTKLRPLRQDFKIYKWPVHQV